MSIDPYVNIAKRMERLQKIADVAEDFIRAHCRLEDLAGKLGANAACLSLLNQLVVELHMKLEHLVLGDEKVPGRRTA